MRKVNPDAKPPISGQQEISIAIKRTEAIGGKNEKLSLKQRLPKKGW
jgi:hypothetical protein